ncbi:MAG TPA: hypothetical protein VFR82_02670 [Nitrospira sp.]|nr:hypothetical protein [Nitrospira sp.]
MSSTITLVVPRVETESVFLQLVVQAAIRAHRDDYPKSHEVKTDTVNDDRSRVFPVAV